MGCAKLGTILETDELRFELLDAVSGGYMSMAAIRVTCKQTDRVLENDKDGNCLWQASFRDIRGTLTDDASISDAGYGYSYRYDDDEMELKPNQFYLIFNTNSSETVQAGTYTLELHVITPLKVGVCVKISNRVISIVLTFLLLLPIFSVPAAATDVNIGVNAQLDLESVSAWNSAFNFGYPDYSVALRALLGCDDVCWGIVDRIAYDHASSAGKFPWF